MEIGQQLFVGAKDFAAVGEDVAPAKGQAGVGHDVAADGEEDFAVGYELDGVQASVGAEGGYAKGGQEGDVAFDDVAAVGEQIAIAEAAEGFAPDIVGDGEEDFTAAGDV